ncbi:Cell division trigger factor [Microcystis aeruginosa NIES-98]|nr:Cell division trigger factor [Microcystis aeruginosa NIES-98]
MIDRSLCPLCLCGSFHPRALEKCILEYILPTKPRRAVLTSAIKKQRVKCPHKMEQSNNPDKFSCPQPDMIEIGDLTIKTNAKFSYL